MKKKNKFIKNVFKSFGKEMILNLELSLTKIKAQNNRKRREIFQKFNKLQHKL